MRSSTSALAIVAVVASLPVVTSARAEEVAPTPPAEVTAPSESSAGTTSVPPAPSAEKSAAAEPPPARWYDGIKLAGFVDAYASVNGNFPKPGVNAFRAYDGTAGFGLHWAGVDASIAEGAFGGTIALRFGPSAPLYAGAVDGNAGLTYVKQAYATWKPLEKLTIDLGKYDQPFGSEVADSQLNPNYTRSALYWYAQPLFFTGLRAEYAFSELFSLKVFAVNGWNVTVDNNSGKSFGAQLTLKPIPELLAAFGYLGGPEQNERLCPAGTTLDAASTTCVLSPGSSGGGPLQDGVNGRWRHLGDVILDVNPTPRVRLLFNASYGTEKLVDQRETFYGANLAIGYAFSDVWSLALRGDLFHDAKGAMIGTGAKTTLIDGTLTVGAKPSKNLLLKLDLRLDHLSVDGASGGSYPKGSDGLTKWQPTATLGVVANTN